MSAIDVTLAGEMLRLYAQRALYWPRARLLAIADLHLGKGDVFRRHGVALPRGGTALDLERLDTLLAACAPATLLVLGDLLHGPVNVDAPWLAQWHTWRDAHPALDLRVVAGNHDRALRRADLRIANDGARRELPPFVFAHDADAEAGSTPLHAIGGHLHPVARLEDAGLRARLPVFWLGARRSVLPAFTAFSGGVYVHTQPGDRLYACAGDGIVTLPAAAYRSTRPA